MNFVWLDAHDWTVSFVELRKHFDNAVADDVVVCII
jgi:hypothetical protein